LCKTLTRYLRKQKYCRFPFLGENFDLMFDRPSSLI
jgi:hypothetical protein